MLTPINNKRQVFVLVLPNNEYKRFVGRVLTHHVASDLPLIAEEIEMFRRDPLSMIEQQTA